MRDLKQQPHHHRDSHLIRRLLSYLKPYQGKFILAFCLMILSSVISLTLPLISGLAIDVMTSATLSFNQKVNIIIIGGLSMVTISGLIVLVSYFQNMILQNVGQAITHNIRQQVFSHIETLDTGQINQIPVGKLVTRASNDPANISDMFTTTIVSLIRNFLMLSIIFVVLFVINWQMALVVMITLPIIVLASILFSRFSRSAHRQVRTNVSSLNSFLSENLSGMKITQIFNQEKKKVTQFDQVNQTLKKSYLREINIFGVFRPTIFFLEMVSTILTLYFGLSTVLQGHLTIGFFVSFYVYVGRFFEPIQQISEQFNALQNGFASAEKIFDILDTKPLIEDDPEAIELSDFKGSVEFRDVWFSYLPDEWVLKGISFKLNPDETIAFVGATGSGKTTILQLLVRNYEPLKGQILIDGVNIKKIKRSSLRSFIGQMMQDTFLFSGTIRDNITLYDQSKTDQNIHQVSEYIGLNHVLDKRSEGLDYFVKERGNNFSSGEKQLLSFARALIYEPRLMILDEATANIDSETEAIIQQSLEKMMSISTMIIVAHRLATIQHSDRIYVMSKGEIKEFGTHQQLLQNKGIYYALYQLQFDKEL